MDLYSKFVQMLRLMTAHMLRRHKKKLSLRLIAFSEYVEKISKLGLKWLERGGKVAGLGFLLWLKGETGVKLSHLNLEACTCRALYTWNLSLAPK